MRVQAFILSLFSTALLLLAGGCAPTRTVTIVTNPPDAKLLIAGQQFVHGPVTQTFVFDDPRESKRVVAQKQGYDDASATIFKDGTEKRILIVMKVQSRRVTINADLDAVIRLDGEPVNGGRPTKLVAQYEIPFPIDAKGYRNPHLVTAERSGYRKAQIQIPFLDPEGDTYTLKLEPMSKALNITSNPPGANVYLGNQLIGQSPVNLPDVAFSYDDASAAFVEKTVKLTMPGYDPVSYDINWDNGRTDYAIDLKPHAKIAHIIVDQPSTALTVDGQEQRPEADGSYRVPLQFQPTNDKGDLQSHKARITKKPDGEWQPNEFAISYDGGKQDYSVKLKQIMTRKMPLLTTSWTYDKAIRSWSVSPKLIDTTARIDVDEDSASSPPVRLTTLQAGAFIDSLSISPDGSMVLFTILSGDKSDFRSQMFTVPTDGSGVVTTISDGKSLDLTPSYTPAGDQIVFSSNRNGSKLNICAMPTTGAPVISQLTSGENNDLYPVVDSDPRPKLYYESRGVRPESRLLFNPFGQPMWTDMNVPGGTQPRVSPRNDQIVFAAVDAKTGKRDLFVVSSKGGFPKNLTNTPDIDEFDPSWNFDGSKIAFASDDGMDADNNRNVDIKVMDMRKSQAVDRVTTNGSQDDCPAWDPSGRAIYFRSNRGGEWAIWKINLK